MNMFKKAMGRARAISALNRPVTTVVRAACHFTGKTPEAVIKHFVRSGPVHSDLPNGKVIRLCTQGDDGVSNEVFWKGWDGYEPETSPIFYKLATRSNVIFDVGAHVGYYSLLAGLANPASRVFAFEPLPRAVRRFRENLRVNEIDNLELIESAVGAETGEASFYCHPETSSSIPSSSGLSKEFFELPYYANDGVSPRMTVQVIRMDDFVEERGIERVDLVKIDTETTEPDVLSGMPAVLNRDHPDLIFEVLPWLSTDEKIDEILSPLGYEYYLLTDKGPQARNRIKGDLHYWNYLARSPKRGRLE